MRQITEMTGDMRAAGAARICFSYSSDDQPWMQRAVIRAVEAVGGRRKLRRLYEDGVIARACGEDIFAAAVRSLGLDVDYDPLALGRVPRSEPVVFVANHPYGVLDGIVLAWLVLKVRPDTRILAHDALSRVPEVGSHLLPIDFAGSAVAAATNLASRREAQRHLVEGGAIAIFPAGGVATTPTPFWRYAYDLPWHPFTGKLVRGAGATVVPIHFGGRNSRLFQLVSHVSVTLRLSLLFHETARRIGSRVQVSIGDPVAYSEVSHLGREALTYELRRRTYALSARPDDWMHRGRIRLALAGGNAVQPCRIMSRARPGPLP